MTILTPSLQSWVYPALHSKKGKGLRFPNTKKAPKHWQSRKVLPEGASAALADLKYCDQGQFMVTDWTTWSQPCNLPLPQLWGLPVYLWRLKPPCYHPSYQRRASSHTARWQQCCSAGTTAGASLAAGFSARAALGCVCHRQPASQAARGQWRVDSARKSAPEGYFGSLATQLDCTRVGWGLNSPPSLETVKLMSNPQINGSERIAGCLWGQGVMTLPITAALNLSKEIQREGICHFPRWNFTEVESITPAGNDILNCFNSLSMFKLISLFHLNGNSHLITLAAKLQIVFESNTT